MVSISNTTQLTHEILDYNPQMEDLIDLIEICPTFTYFQFQLCYY